MALGIEELKPSRIFPVAQELWFRLLKTKSNVFRPRSQGWVRLRGCSIFGKQHKNDLALVCSVGRSGLLEVIIVPRTNLGSTKRCREWEWSSPRILTTQQLLSISEAGSDDPDGDEIRLESGFTFTCDGFQVLKDVDLESYIPVEALPTLDELQVFTQSRRLLPDTYTHAQNLISRHQIQLGHRVMVLSGEFRELVGNVVEVSQDSIIVYLPSQDYKYETMIHNLRKEFRIGDEVSIIAGDHIGTDGWITQLESSHVTICSTSGSEFSEVR